MIRVRSLHKAFAGRELFGDLSFEVGAGEAVAVVGSSGAGKTTLLRILSGLALPDRGTVEVEGRDLGQLGVAQRARLRAGHIGFVFQGTNLLPHLSGVENVRLPSAFSGKAIAPVQARAALQSVGLEAKGDDRGATFSGGEAQRLAVARAIAQRPAVLLCDEPTGSLDKEAGLQVGNLLLKAADELGCALIVATHDLALAERCGRQLQIGPVR